MATTGGTDTTGEATEAFATGSPVADGRSGLPAPSTPTAEFANSSCLGLAWRMGFPARRESLSMGASIVLLGAAMAGEERFSVVGGHPIDGARDLPVDASFHLRLSAPADPSTLDDLKVFQRIGESWREVDVRAATDLTGASITLVPADLLQPATAYEIRASGALKSTGGNELREFRRRFETGEAATGAGGGTMFTARVFDNTRSMTTVLFGPDRRLYAADAFGTLVRWELGDGGIPEAKQVLLDDPRRSRQYIDLEWDPAATADRLVLWVSYGERLADVGEHHYYTGTIARLAIGENGSVQERVAVKGLPHGRERQGGFDTLPHQPNGLVFRKDMLYQSIGSTTSCGGPANWGIPEQPLSACVIEIDYREISETLDVHPAAGFDPGSADAPLRVFATGVRNALELVAHSNGHLYTAVNINDRRGASDGVPDHPGIPGDQNKLVRNNTPDHESLFILRRGGHYGFPNPARGQYVLGGGNPTTGADPFEIVDYPVGTPPDPSFDPRLWFPLWRYGGTSPNGMIEFQSETPHPLQGALICCRNWPPSAWLITFSCLESINSIWRTRLMQGQPNISATNKWVLALAPMLVC